MTKSIIKKYDKLVRDKIPEICLRRGAIPETRTASVKEYKDYIQRKVLEEAKEIMAAKDKKELLHEVADIYEILDALCQANGFTKKIILKIRKEKNQQRGAFKKRIILISTKEQS